MSRKKKRHRHRPQFRIPQPRQERPERMLPEQEFFRKIDDPLSFRRYVLESSKSSLGVLKGIYAIKEIRKKKLDKLVQLQKAVREIRLLIQKSEEMMPKYTRQQAIRHFPHLAPVKKKKEAHKKPEPKIALVPKKIEPVVVQRTMSEIDRLSQSIEKIESRIKQLPPPREIVVQVPASPAPPAPKVEKKAELAPAKQESKQAEKKPVDKKQKAPEDLGSELGKALDKIHQTLKDI